MYNTFIIVKKITLLWFLVTFTVYGRGSDENFHLFYFGIFEFIAKLDTNLSVIFSDNKIRRTPKRHCKQHTLLRTRHFTLVTAIYGQFGNGCTPEEVLERSTNVGYILERPRIQNVKKPMKSTLTIRQKLSLNMCPKMLGFRDTEY